MRKPVPIRFIAVHRVTHREDRIREAAFWSSRTMAERVIAGWALSDDDLMSGENDESEKRTGFTLRRVPHGER